MVSWFQDDLIMLAIIGGIGFMFLVCCGIYFPRLSRTARFLVGLGLIIFAFIAQDVAKILHDTISTMNHFRFGADFETRWRLSQVAGFVELAQWIFQYSFVGVGGAILVKSIIEDTPLLENRTRPKEIFTLGFVENCRCSIRLWHKFILFVKNIRSQ